MQYGSPHFKTQPAHTSFHPKPRSPCVLLLLCALACCCVLAWILALSVTVTALAASMRIISAPCTCHVCNRSGGLKSRSLLWAICATLLSQQLCSHPVCLRRQGKPCR